MRLRFFLLCFVLFVSGPAHILCLTVASGWNKERCIPEALPLLHNRNFCRVLHACCHNPELDIRFGWIVRNTCVSTCDNLALVKSTVNSHYKHVEDFSTDPNLKSWTIFSQGLNKFYIFPIKLVNTKNVSVTKIVDSSSIQRAETKYGLRIQFLALVVMILELWLNA